MNEKERAHYFNLRSSEDREAFYQSTKELDADGNAEAGKLRFQISSLRQQIDICCRQMHDTRRSEGLKESSRVQALTLLAKRGIAERQLAMLLAGIRKTNLTT